MRPEERIDLDPNDPGPQGPSDEDDAWPDADPWGDPGQPTSTPAHGPVSRAQATNGASWVQTPQGRVLTAHSADTCTLCRQPGTRSNPLRWQCDDWIHDNCARPTRKTRT